MDLNPTLEIQLAAQIMSGLLSSGHYTQPNVKSSDLKHLIRRHGENENWEADGLRVSQSAYVVDDALFLLAELNLALESGATPQLAVLRPQKKKVAAAKAKKVLTKKRKKK